MWPCPDTCHTLHCQQPGLSLHLLTHFDVHFWIASTSPPMYPEAYEPAFSLTIYLEWNWRFKMEYVSLQQNIQELFKLIASYKKNPVLGTFDIFDVMFSYLVDIEWYFTVFFF